MSHTIVFTVAEGSATRGRQNCAETDQVRACGWGENEGQHLSDRCRSISRQSSFTRKKASAHAVAEGVRQRETGILCSACSNFTQPHTYRKLDGIKANKDTYFIIIANSDNNNSRKKKISSLFLSRDAIVQQTLGIIPDTRPRP